MGFLEDAVAVGVFVDGDAVGTFVVTRRGGRDFVINGTEILIVLHDFEAGGEGVLEILHDPETAAFVEVQVQRLPHGGFAGGEGHLETGGDLEIGERLLGCWARDRLVAERAAGFEAFDEVLDAGIEGGGGGGAHGGRGGKGEESKREGFGEGGFHAVW